MYCTHFGIYTRICNISVSRVWQSSEGAEILINFYHVSGEGENSMETELAGPNTERWRVTDANSDWRARECHRAARRWRGIPATQWIPTCICEHKCSTDSYSSSGQSLTCNQANIPGYTHILSSTQHAINPLFFKPRKSHKHSHRYHCHHHLKKSK